MSLWVLDTDTLSLLLHEHPGVTAQALIHPRGLVALSIVSVQETFLGRYNKITQARTSAELIVAYGQLEASIKLIRVMSILSYDSRAAEKYVELRRTYRRMSKNDLRIAAITMSRSATLVTRNFADFGQIDGLQLEDWSHG